MQDQKIIKLSDRAHILLRPSMYVGGVDLVEKEEYILTKENKFEYKKLKFVPGLIKITNEIIDNSVDEAVRTGFKFGNKIDVNITDTSIEIRDNGRGIPVVKIGDTEHYAPVVAFCEARAGSNFSDDGRTTIGMNGVGSFATNVFSKVFKATTADGKKRLKLISKSNAETVNFTITDTEQKFTKVYFEPDFKRFEINKMDDVHKSIIKQRLYFLSVAHPQIRFTFNKERIHFKNKEHFVKLFSESYEIFDMKKYFIAVLPNDTDDFSFFSYVNGLYIKNGGNHINLITNDIVSRIRDKMSRRYKNIKPGDIKNKLKLLVFMNDFENMKFDSQTKENLTNSVTHIRAYMDIDQKRFDNWVNYKVYKNEAIIDPILETYRIREEFKKRADLKNMSRPKKRLNIEKYLPPTEHKKYLCLAEGDSAAGGISRILGRKDFGYFALRGKPLNVYEAQTSKIVANQEIKNIVDILELDMSDPNTNMSYDNVLIATDADLDGLLIRGLLLTFFNKYASKLLKEGRIRVLYTPMVIAFDKTKVYKYFFDFESYNSFMDSNTKKLHYVYYKGLGTFKGPELKEIFAKEGVNKFIESFDFDNKTEKSINDWMSNKTADIRKTFLRNKEFDIYQV